MSNVLLIANNSNNSTIIQPEQPPTQMAAWFIPVADGTDPLQAASEWAAGQHFQTGTCMYVLQDPSGLETYTLASQWVAGTATT